MAGRVGCVVGGFGLGGDVVSAPIKESMKAARAATAAELVKQIASQILVRRGEVITAELAEERARNIVAGLDGVQVEEDALLDGPALDLLEDVEALVKTITFRIDDPRAVLLDAVHASIARARGDANQAKAEAEDKVLQAGWAKAIMGEKACTCGFCEACISRRVRG